MKVTGHDIRPKEVVDMPTHSLSVNNSLKQTKPQRGGLRAVALSSCFTERKSEVLTCLSSKNGSIVHRGPRCQRRCAP